MTTTHAFSTDVGRLFDIMVHSVYSNRDIFLRELISNAADACEKLRYLAIAEPALLGGEAGMGITVSLDEAGRRITVADSGIGMSEEELVGNLGTIARSGTRAFLDGLSNAKDGGALIGQFGIGFYAAFMVADRVRVTSRRAGATEAFAWTSEGQGSFTIEAVDLPDAPARGTRVEVFLKEDAVDYASEETAERIIRAYSSHVPVPIHLKVGDGEPREVTDGSAIWVKPKAQVTAEAYQQAYRTLGDAYDEPALTIHYKAEGRHDYSVLLFVPEMKPFDLFDPSRKGRVKLYVRRVFITDEAEVLPGWLRFVRGVVDSEDLPLNLSREMLQKNPVIEAIGKGVTGRVLSELSKLAENDAERFAKVWDAFGAVIKEGLYEAPDRRDDLFKLTRFKTSTSGEGWRSLADVVKDFKTNQTAIYYALGDSEAAILASPHLEGYRARGLEVLFLTDPVDAFWVRTALGFDGKPFRSITQGAADLENIELVEKPADMPAADAAEGAALIRLLKETLGEKVSDVRASQRLATSAVCLVAADYGLDKMTERLMARQEGGRGFGAKPVLEVNPGHSLIRALSRQAARGMEASVRHAAPLLLAQARILDGEAPEDPAAFALALSQMMEAALPGE